MSLTLMVLLSGPAGHASNDAARGACDRTRLGSYEVLSLLGKGGTGEVYRARDARLKRDVAIKILPNEFANNPERSGRFHCPSLKSRCDGFKRRVGGISVTKGFDADPIVYGFACNAVRMSGDRFALKSAR